MSAMASKMSGFGWQEVLNAETAQLDGSWLKSDGSVRLVREEQFHRLPVWDDAKQEKIRFQGSDG